MKKWAGNKVAPAGPPKPPGVPPPPGPRPPPPGAPPHPAAGAPPQAAHASVIGNVPSSSLPPDQAQWAMAGGKDPQRPDNPPAWVDDEASWEQAKRAVEKNWDTYDEPWAVVASLYSVMSG